MVFHYYVLLEWAPALLGVSHSGCMHFVFVIVNVQESSAKLTNQRVSYMYAFTSSPFNFHACHILPASKFQYSYSCILLIFYRHQ